jgi:hypothetical protein
MKALSSANLLSNGISIDQARSLGDTLAEHPSLKSLCGNKGDETKLDMSGKDMGAAGIAMLAPELVANGELSALDLASNNLRSPGAKVLADVLSTNTTITELNIWGNNLRWPSADDAGPADDFNGLTASENDDFNGLIALAEAITGNQALPLAKLTFGGDAYYISSSRGVERTVPVVFEVGTTPPINFWDKARLGSIGDCVLAYGWFAQTYSYQRARLVVSDTMLCGLASGLAISATAVVLLPMWVLCRKR